MGREGRLDGAPHRGGDVGGGRRGAGRLGDRGDDRDVVELLEGARPPTSLGRPPGQDDQGRTVEVGGRRGAHAVGDTGPGRQDGHTRPTGELGHPLGGEGGGLLVAHVDDPHAGLHAGVVDGEDVAAREREDGVDTLIRQPGQHQLPAVALGRHLVLPSRRRLR